MIHRSQSSALNIRDQNSSNISRELNLNRARLGICHKRIRRKTAFLRTFENSIYRIPLRDLLKKCFDGHCLAPKLEVCHHLVGLTHVARLRLRQEDLARVRGQKLVGRVAHQRDMLGQASASTLNERRLQKLSASGLCRDERDADSVVEQLAGDAR